MQICGIDPGLRSTGWGIIRFDGNRLIWIADGMIRPDPDKSMAERLNHIRTDLADVISTYQPDRAAIEEIFVAKNAASALKLGMARGVAIVTLADAGLSVDEIAARRVKQNVTGSGRADKNQVSAMVSRLLNVTPSGADAADALAVAISASNETSLWANDDQASVTDRLGYAISAALARQGGQS
jgi:crossover junction endodeoxyribonuclease RuvC